MCRYNRADDDFRERQSSSAALLTTTFPRIIQALIRLKRRADSDYYIIQCNFERINEMESIINKLILTHIDSDNYVNYLFKRAEQLSEHLETYENIIGKIKIGDEIQQNFKQISYEFIDYLKRKIEFKSVWIESMQTIELGRQTIKDKITNLDDFKQAIEYAYENDEYFLLNEHRIEFDEQVDELNNIVDNCFRCGQRSKELSTILYDKLTELEKKFQGIVRDSMNKINDIKRNSSTPIPSLH